VALRRRLPYLALLLSPRLTALGSPLAKRPIEGRTAGGCNFSQQFGTCGSLDCASLCVSLDPLAQLHCHVKTQPKRMFIFDVVNRPLLHD
jgi:hypothetical protein